MKYESVGKIMKEFCALRAKASIYVTDKKMKISTKKCLIKRKFKFDDYKNCLKATQPKNKINQLQKIKLIQKCLEKTIKKI